MLTGFNTFGRHLASAVSALAVSAIFIGAAVGPAVSPSLGSAVSQAHATAA